MIHAAAGHSSFDVANITTPVFTDPGRGQFFNWRRRLGATGGRNAGSVRIPNSSVTQAATSRIPIDRIVEDLRVLT